MSIRFEIINLDRTLKYEYLYGRHRRCIGRGGHMSVTCWTFLFVAFLAHAAFAAEVREIQLHDGSIITGEIVSFHGGVYTVRSESLGSIDIEESKINTIRMSSSHTAADEHARSGREGNKTREQIQDMKTHMMEDADIMEIIQSLQNDPDVQKLLSDPEAMKAIQSGDLAAILSNPAIKKLLEKPEVQEIKNKMNK